MAEDTSKPEEVKDTAQNVDAPEGTQAETAKPEETNEAQTDISDMTKSSAATEVPQEQEGTSATGDSGSSSSPQKPADDEALRKERQAVAKDVQILLTAKLEKHEIEPDRAKDIALKVVDELRGAQNHFELEKIIPHLSEEFNELHGILNLEIKHRRDSLDALVSKVVSELIHHSEFQKAIDLAHMDIEAKSLEDLDAVEQEMTNIEQGVEETPAALETGATAAQQQVQPAQPPVQQPPAPPADAGTPPPPQPATPPAPPAPPTPPPAQQPAPPAPQAPPADTGTPPTPPPAVGPPTPPPQAPPPPPTPATPPPTEGVTTPGTTTQQNPAPVPKEGSTAEQVPDDRRFSEKVDQENLTAQEPSLTDKLQKGIGTLQEKVKPLAEKAKKATSQLKDKVVKKDESDV